MYKFYRKTRTHLEMFISLLLGYQGFTKNCNVNYKTMFNALVCNVDVFF